MRTGGRISWAVAAALVLCGCTINLPGSATPTPPPSTLEPGPTTPTSASAGSPSKTPSPSAPSPSPSERDQDPWAVVLEKVRRSVVRLNTTECAGDPYMGSGFVVGKNLVMTAAHVVDGVRDVSVRTEDGDITPAEIVALDLSEDAALVRTDEALPGAPMVLEEEPLRQGPSSPRWAIRCRPPA